MSAPCLCLQAGGKETKIHLECTCCTHTPGATGLPQDFWGREKQSDHLRNMCAGHSHYSLCWKAVYQTITTHTFYRRKSSTYQELKWDPQCSDTFHHTWSLGDPLIKPTGRRNGPQYTGKSSLNVPCSQHSIACPSPHGSWTLLTEKRVHILKRYFPTPIFCCSDNPGLPHWVMMMFLLLHTPALSPQPVEKNHHAIAES